jgi:hypothetical protein
MLHADSSKAAAIRELKASAGDLVDGGRATCLPKDKALAWIQSELARLGLTGWKTQITDRGDGGGIDPNACVMIDVSEDQIVDVLTPAVESESEITELANLPQFAALRKGITDGCVDLGQAGVVVDEAEKVAKADGDGPWTKVNVLDESATCSRVDVEYVGSTQVTIYGPSSVKP